MCSTIVFNCSFIYRIPFSCSTDFLTVLLMYDPSVILLLSFILKISYICWFAFWIPVWFITVLWLLRLVLDLYSLKSISHGFRGFEGKCSSKGKPPNLLPPSSSPSASRHSAWFTRWSEGQTIYFSLMLRPRFFPMVMASLTTTRPKHSLCFLDFNL